MTGKHARALEPDESMDYEALVAALPGLLRYARTMTNDAALAEDLVQTTVLRAMERGGFRGESSLSTWLHRILHHSFVDHVRRDREVPDDDVWSEIESRWSESSFTLDAAEMAERVETAADVRDALVRVPVTHRSAVVLHDMEGLTVPEVAQIQKISLAAAKQRVRRGRLMLVDALASASARREAMQGVPMDCWSVRTQVSDYLDRDLLPEQARLLERHLESCPTCPPLYAAIVGTQLAVSDLRDADSVIPPELAERLTGVAKGSDHGPVRPGGTGL
ncbi:sigma-70 family RNA polymerase sigma factor [Nocardioides sp. GXZ039]|uniref:sigma-70 family RNA polymerase sigma factor n=1 Tax=Nocardioides sp. GXZ039 TaxID=3136018 RepID=UPI0030F3ECDB